MAKRVVFFPLPFEGHLNMLLSLANVLHSRGFSISVICTHFNAPNPAKYPHFSFHLIYDGLSESDASVKNVLYIANVLNKTCMEPFMECLSRILSNASHEEPLACLITDAMCHFSLAVADDLKLPRIVLKTSNIACFAAFFVLEFGGEKGLRAIREQQPEDLIPEFPPLRVKDLPRAYIRNQYPILELLPNMMREIKASKGIILNSFEEVEERSLAIVKQEFSIPIFPVGPCHNWLPSPSTSLSDQDKNTLSWLDTQAANSVLYVSLGTIAFINEATFLEMAWVLAKCNQPFLWVVRHDLVHNSKGDHLGSSLLPDGFLQEVSGRGHIVSWAPQRSVLAHPAVGGFWTHNGWNSTLESICEGVPMICSPSFGDQMLNCRLVSEDWHIGLLLEKDAKREDMEKAIRKLMVEKEGEEMRERAACFKTKATNCLLPGGSPTRTWMIWLISFSHFELLFACL